MGTRLANPCGDRRQVSRVGPEREPRRCEGESVRADGQGDRPGRSTRQVETGRERHAGDAKSDGDDT